MTENLVSDVIAETTTDAIEETSSFGADLAKTFLLSAAATAGMIGGLVAVGFVKKKIDERRRKEATIDTTIDAEFKTTESPAK